MKQQTGGPSTSARIPHGDPRQRRNAGQAVAGTSLGPPFVVDRVSGQQEFAFDTTLQIIPGNGQLGVRFGASLSSTTAGLAMTPSAAVPNVPAGASLADVIVALNLLLQVRRDAGEQRR